MSAPYWIMLASLAAAVLLTALAESRACAHSQRVASVLAWAALLCCYGVCVGLLSVLLAHFLQVSEWVAVAIAVPLACPVLVLAAKASES